jgi:hypothetical protein
MMKIFVLIVALFCLLLQPSSATDWEDCADELDRLRRASQNASDMAKDVASAKEDVESAKEDLRQCIEMPKLFDERRDGCRSLMGRHDAVMNHYRAELSKLESELSAVQGRLRSVQLSCGYKFSLSEPEKPAKDLCSMYRRHRDQLPLQTLMDMCLKSMKEGDCVKCLMEPAKGSASEN